jgi:hypothetical protein
VRLNGGTCSLRNADALNLDPVTGVEVCLVLSCA